MPKPIRPTMFEERSVLKIDTLTILATRFSLHARNQIYALIHQFDIEDHEPAILAIFDKQSILAQRMQYMWKTKLVSEVITIYIFICINKFNYYYLYNLLHNTIYNIKFTHINAHRAARFPDPHTLVAFLPSPFSIEALLLGSRGGVEPSESTTISITVQGFAAFSQEMFTVDIMSPVADLIDTLESLAGSSLYLLHAYKPLRPHLTWNQYGITSDTALNCQFTILGGSEDAPEIKTDLSIDTSALNVAPPTFFTDQSGSPKVWLELMHFRFQSQGIKAQHSLFQHLLGTIPADQLQAIAPHLSTIVQHKEPYDQLRKQIMLAHEPTFDAVFENYFKTQQIGLMKPSQFLQRVIADLELIQPGITQDQNNAILKKFFIQSLPPMHKAILAATTTTDLKELAAIADRIAETVPSGSDSCFQVTSASVDNNGPTSQQNAHITALTAQVEQMAAMMTTLTSSITSLTTASHPQQRGRSPSRGRFSNNRNSSVERQPICYYHRRFGNKARKCQPGCTWKCDRTALEITEICILHSKYGDQARSCAPGCKYQASKN